VSAHPPPDPTAEPHDRPSPAAVHSSLHQRFATEAEAHERLGHRIALLRLSTFLAGAVLTAAGVWERSGLQLGLGLLLLAGFAAAVVWDRRVSNALAAAEARRDLHQRHLSRLSLGWREFQNRGQSLLPPDHAYAWDIDLLGPGSLFQRIDVSHTVHGERTLARWLGEAAEPETIAARQAAVQELAAAVELRQELEAAGVGGTRAGDANEKLDGSSFEQFSRLPSYFEGRPWLTPTIFVLPPLTALGYALGSQGAIPGASWLLPLSLQLSLLFASGRATRRAFNLAAARQGVVEAFEKMLQVVEAARFDSPLMQQMQARLSPDGSSIAAQMRRLRSWASAAELRKQGLLYIFINPVTLWDLHVLRGLERWNRDVGRHTGRFFEALGELEALCALATLRFLEPDSHLPEVVDDDRPLSAQALGHPLLEPGARVCNDLQLEGPGSALIVTGSNMAGKSTLLRALGLNAALALAGGPVCAARMTLPPLRLRASMRIQDSLQEGASYFHAELSKLRSVVADAEARPPVLFLLDELLRGTNARARHIGARAVLEHLLERSGTGLVATHDVALSRMEQAADKKIRNAHFTDVVTDGEMRFDYRLQPGVVRTSNALRLLALAGIDVATDDDLVMAEDMAIGSGSENVETV